LIGLDTNILVYALDPTFPEHMKAKNAILSLDGWFINSTVIHETYHTLVYKRKMMPTDAKKKLIEFLGDKRTFFVNQTKLIAIFSLSLAVEYNLGGRDSLIIGCYLYNKINNMLTHDDEILKLKGLKFRGKSITFKDPIK